MANPTEKVFKKFQYKLFVRWKEIASFINFNSYMDNCNPMKLWTHQFFDFRYMAFVQHSSSNSGIYIYLFLFIDDIGA